MALALTTQGTADLANTTEGTSHDGTIDCGTVTTGAMLIVAAGGTGGTVGTTWTTPTKSSGTATIGTAVQIGSTAGGGTYQSTVMAWRIPITTGGTLVLSIGDGNQSFGAHYHAIQYTGQDSTTPIAGAVTQYNATDNADLANSTLGATPATADEVVAIVNYDTDAGAGKGITPGTNFTERYDTGATDDYVQMQTATRAGSVSTSTTVVWGTQDDTPASYEAAGLAFIVKAAAGGSDASVSATVVTASASVPAPTVSVGRTVTATVVTATASVPAPTVSTAANANVTATVVTALASVPTPTVSVGVTITATVVTATASVPAPSVSVYAGLWPTSIDGTNKRILDQNGDPLFMVGDSAWSLVGQLSTTDIDTYIDAVDAKGFTAIMFSAPEAYYTDNTPAYRNAAGDLPFSGTNFASSLVDAYWDVVDHAIDKAATLGITCIVVPQYSGYADSADGWSVDVEAAYDASTANLTTYGAALATRYSSYPNIVWMLGHDRVPTQKFKAASKLIADELASGTSHMIIHGGWHTSSTSSTGDTDWNAVTGTDITTDFDTVYVYNETSGEAVESAIATKTSIFLEGKYEQEQSQVVGDQTLREQMWEPLMAGASGAFFGNNPRWHFESGKEIYGFSGTWQNSLTNTTYNDGTVHASYLASFLGSVSGVLTSTPDTTDTFLVSGTGWARFSGSVGLVYQTAAASITIDTTELTGTGNVRIRRYDPTDGSFTTVAASEAQNATRAISHPGTNANGDNDYVYVVDLLGDTTVSATVVTASASVPSATVTSSVAITATVVTATADTPAPTASAGTGVSVTATVATALADVPSATASAGSSLTATVVTALADIPTPSVSTSGNASVTAVVVTATADVPAPSVSAGSSATVTATVVTALAEVPTATAAASASITAVVVTATADVPAPSVSTGGGVSISVTVVTATASVPAPTLALSAGVSASVVTALAEVLAATVVAGVIAAIYGPALESDPPPILTWNPPPILTGRSS